MKLLSFVKRRLFFYKKEVKSSCLLYTSFFFICFTLFGLAWSHLSYMFEVVPLSLNPQVLIYNVDDFTPEIMKKNEQDKLEQFVSDNRLYFKIEDKNAVEKFPDVENVTLMNTGFDGRIENQWQLDANIFSSTQRKALGLSKDIELITISVGYSPFPKKFTSYYFPMEAGTLIQGEFPDDNSNEILIPDIYAGTFKESFEELIGKEVTLPIKLVEDEGRKKESNTFTISGIYHFNSNPQNPTEISRHIFLNYEQDDALSPKNIAERYEAEKLAYETYNDETKQLFSSILASEASYKEALGSSKSYMLIICKEGKVEEVIDQVSTLFPDYEPYWQGAYKSPENQAVYHDFIRGFAIAVTVISLIFSVSVYITKRRNAEVENKEHALLFSQGYSTFELIRIIFYEQVLLLGFSFLFAQVLLVVAQKFILPHLNFYESLSFWTSRNIWLYVSFFVLTLCFNTLLTCFSIRKKRLIQYLK